MPSRHLLVMGTFALSLLLYIDRVCISAAREGITGDLGLTDVQFGWVLSIFALGYALFQTPSGMLADRVGPRKVLTTVVVFWSVFTAATGAAVNFVMLMIYRFLFGAGEAGAFPGISRAVYSWIPLKERGLVNGINFSGSRIGGAAALVAMPPFIATFGWRESFYILGGIGIVWAAFWWLWFRDRPEEKPAIKADELAYIQQTRQEAVDDAEQVSAPPLRVMLSQRNMWIVMAQYVCSNFTFFFTLSWLYPYIRQTYSLDIQTAGFYAAAPLIAGAFGNWFAGWLVDRIYSAGHWTWSRRAPAMIGFALGAVGLFGSLGAETAGVAVFWLSVAVFGVDMTLPSSWSFCTDIGRKSAGAVSGTMNMAGNFGSFATALAFPYLAAWFGSNEPFFLIAAGLNAVAALLWLLADPQAPIRQTATA